MNGIGRDITYKLCFPNSILIVVIEEKTVFGLNFANYPWNAVLRVKSYVRVAMPSSIIDSDFFLWIIKEDTEEIPEVGIGIGFIRSVISRRPIGQVM